MIFFFNFSENPVDNKKPLAPDSTNGAYSRFGFKLRKTEAVDIISKKQTGAVDSRYLGFEL